MPGYILLDNTYLNGVQGGINLANAATYATTNGVYGALFLSRLTSGSLAGSTGITLNGVSNTSGHASVEPSGNPINSATTININAINASSTGWGFATQNLYSNGPLSASGNITLVAAVGGSGYNAAAISSPITSTNGNVTITATSSGTGKTIDANAAITGNKISIAATASSTQATVMSLGALTINACSTGCSRRDLTVTATNGTAGGNTGISQTGAITQNANGGSISFASNNSINQTGALSMVANTSGNPSSVTYDTTTGTRLSTITSGALTVGTGSNTAINFIEKTAGAAITVAGISVPGSITLDNTYGCSGSGCTPSSGFINSSNATTLGASTHAIMINTGALTSGAYAIAEGITIKGVTANGYGIYSTQAITANKNNVVMTGVGTSGGVNQYNNVIARDGSIAISGTSASASGTGIYGYILNGAFKASGAIDLAGYTNFADGGSAIELNGLSLISGGNTTLSGRGGVSRVVYLPYVVAGVGGNFTVQGARLTNGIAAADAGTLVSARDNAINISGGSFTRPFEGQSYKDYTVAGDIWIGGTSSVVSNTHIIVLQAGSMTSTGGNITVIGKGEEATNTNTSTQAYGIQNNLIATTGNITLASHQKALGVGNSGAMVNGSSTTNPLLIKAGGNININSYASGTSTGSGYAFSALNYVLFKAGGDITFSSTGSSNKSIILTNSAAQAGGNLTFQGAALGTMGAISDIAVAAPGTAAGNSLGHAVFLNGNIGLSEGTQVTTGYNAAGNINIAGRTTGANYGVFSNAQITSTAGSVTITGTGTTNMAVYDTALITGATGINVTGTSTTAATVVSLVGMTNTTSGNITVTGNNTAAGSITGITQSGQITQNANGGNISFVSNNKINQTGALALVANTSANASSVTYDTTRGTKDSTITNGTLTVASGSTIGINFIEKTAGAAISVATINVPGYILLDNTWGAASGTPSSGYITAANAATLATASAGVSVNGALTAGAYAGSTGITLKGISAAGYGVYSASNLTSGTGAYLTGTTSGTGSDAVYLNNVALNAAGTFNAGQDAIFISGTNGTTSAVNLLGNTSITNNSTRGRINIIANNGNFLDPVTVTSSSTAGAISVAAIGSTAAIVSAAGTIFTQNSNDGVYLSTSNGGNIRPPRIINNGSGSVYVAAGSYLPVGTGSGGQIVGVSGNTISQAGGGITYLYSGNPTGTTGLSLLATPLATQTQANVRFGQAAASGNVAFSTIPAIDGALYNTANLATASTTNPVIRYRIDPNFNLRLSASEFSKLYGTDDGTALSTYLNSAIVTSGYSSTRSTTSAVTSYNATTGNFSFTYGPVVMTFSKAQLAAGLLADNTGNRTGYGTVAGQQVNTTTGYAYGALKSDSFIGGTLNAVNASDVAFTLIEKITPRALTITNLGTSQIYSSSATYDAVGTAAGTSSSGLLSNVSVDGVTLTDTLSSVTNVHRSGSTIGTGTPINGTTTAQVGSFNSTPGSAVISGSGGTASSGNYAITYVGAVNTITPRIVTVTVDGATTSLVYNGSLQTNAQPTVVGVEPGDSISFTGLAAGTNVGIYNDNLVAVAGSGTNLANYSFTINNGKLTITPAALTISGSTTSTTYDGTARTNTYTLSGLQGSDLSKLTVSGSGSGTNAGTYSDNLQLSDNAAGAVLANYDIRVSNSSLTIAAKAATLIGNVSTKEYNGQAQTSGYTLAGVLDGDLSDVTVNGAAFATHVSEGLVNDAFSVSGLKAGNYSFSFTPGSIQITPRALTVAGRSGTAVYNRTTQINGDATVTGLVSGDRLTISGYASGRNVGTSADNLSVSLDNPSDYALMVTNGSFTITPAILNVGAISAATRAYDGGTAAAIDTSGATVSGIYSGDDVQLDIGSVSGAFADKNAGVGKSVSVSGLTLSGADAANYQFNGGAALTISGTINPATLTVTGADDSTTYNGQAQTLAAPQVGGLVAGDNLLVNLNLNGGASVTNAGIYTGSYSLGGTDAGNYVLSANNPVLTINKAVLTITANNAGKSYATSDPTLTTAISGLQGSDTLAGIGVSTSVSRASGEDAGTYAITPSGISSTDNYSITYQPGQFTIVPAGSLLVLMDAASTTYGTAANKTVKAVTYSTSGATPTQVTLTSTDGLSWTDGISTIIVAPDLVAGNGVNGLLTPVGTYIDAITGVVSGNTSNFTGISVLKNTLTVSQAPLSISIGDVSRVYNATAYMGTPVLSANGLMNGETLTGLGGVALSGAALGSINAGSFAILGTTGTGFANYNVTITPGTLTTSPAALTFTGQNRTVTYNATSQTNLAPLVSGWQGNDALGGAVTISGLASGLHAGTYTDAYVIGGSLGGNYVIDPNSTIGQLRIDPASLTVSGAVNRRVYTATLQTNSAAQISGLQGTDSVTLSGYAQATRVLEGTVPDNLTVTLSNPNDYVLSVTQGSLTITPVQLDVSGSAGSGPRLTASADKTYDGTTTAGGGLNVAGLLGSDALSASASSGAFDSADAGLRTATFGGITLSGDPDTLANYALPVGTTTFSTQADIAKAQLTITGATGSQVYNGATQTNGAATITGLAAGDSLTIGGYGSGRNVGTYGDNLVATAGANTSLSNYAITYVNGALTITPYILDLSGTATSGPRLTASAAKTYDGTTVAGGLGVTGLLGGDQLTISGGSGSFADGNAGSGKTVTFGGFSLSGADEANYALPSGTPSFSTTADIAKAQLTITGATTTRLFNGAQQSNGPATVAGLADGDQIALAGYGSGRDPGVYSDALVVTAVAGTSLMNYEMTVLNGAIIISQVPSQPPSQPIAILPIFTVVNPGVVQNQQSSTPMNGSEQPSGAAPINPSSLPSPYPISMATDIEMNTQDSGEATALGPLRPFFLVQTERSERFLMGRGNVRIHPGRDVCLEPSGCSKSSASVPGAQALQIMGVEAEPRFPGTISWLRPEELSARQRRRRFPAASALRANNRLDRWLSSSR